MENGEQLTFEFEQRPTIKGFPELRWTGKRPYRSTQYYPAQLRETYGKEQNGWINKIFWGDNLQVMSHLLKEYRGQIDLIYIDPPFDSKADYKKKIEIKGVGKAVSDSSSFEEKQYGDIWTNDEYLQFMYERILLLRELLSDTGSIFLHCDDSRNFYLRCLLSEVFGEDNFHNEIIWKRSTATGLASKRCGTLHDTIYWYSKTDQYYFEMQYHEYEEDYLKRARKDENGRMYIPIPTGNPGPRPNLYYEYKGYWPHANGYKWTREKMEEFDKQGRLIFPDSPNGRIQYKQYLDEMKGTKLQDIWLDVYPVNPVAKERNGYPTQKSEALLERIIKMCAPKNGLVFDCFMGSGTTQAAAMKLGRRFIGADINLGAIQTTTKRLLSVAKELEDGQTCMESSGEIKYTGFEVYNVNNYDFFRNPVEARDLLIKDIKKPSNDNRHKYQVRVLPPPRTITLKRIWHEYTLHKKEYSQPVDFKLAGADLSKYASTMYERDSLARDTTVKEKNIDYLQENMKYSEYSLAGEVARYLNISCILAAKILREYIRYFIPLAMAISSAAACFAFTTVSSILLSPLTSISW